MSLLKKIEAVKVLGVRTAEETKILFTHNSSVYCCLFVYSDGSKEVKELSTKEINKVAQYIV